MHDYSIDTNIRRGVHVAIAVVSLSLPAWITAVAARFGTPALITFPISFGATFALLEWLFDRFLWKIIANIAGIPVLSGDWEGRGTSSWINPETNQNHRYEMDITIKQSFLKMEVHTETEKSTSRSFMASIETEHAVTQFRYGFDNIPKNMADAEMQRHSGLMDLRVKDSNTMAGDYFSGKHRTRHGEIEFKRKSKNEH